MVSERECLYHKQFAVATVTGLQSCVEMSEELPGPPAVHPALARHTGFLLSRMGMVAQRSFAARLETVELSARMWGALNVLDAEGEITQHQLGRCAGIDPSSMVGTIDELERRGLVERRRHPTDRRAHALHLTPRGRRTLSSARELARSAQEDLLAPLDGAERALLHSLLLRLAHATASGVPPAGSYQGAGNGGRDVSHQTDAPPRVP